MSRVVAVAILLLGFRARSILATIGAADSGHSSRRLLYGSRGSGYGSSGSGYGSGYGSTPTTPPSTPTTGTTGVGSAQADPQVVDFAGRAFEFIGEAGSFYNVIQDTHHQVSMRLKLGVLSDHNGTYIDGIGLSYCGHTITMELMPNTDDMIVTLDNEQIVMRDGTTSLQLSAPMAQGRLRISWELFRPNFGNTITIQTDLLRFTVYRTDKGSLDKGGLPQPAFLNFDAELLYPVAHTMQGIVGEGYTRVLNGEAHSLPNDGTFYGSPDDYLLPGYFLETALPQAHIAHRRMLAPIRGPDQAQEDGFLAAAAPHLDASALHVVHAGSI